MTRLACFATFVATVFAAEALDDGRWLHMGRVNSQRRMRYAYWIGCDSVDGTFLAFGPDTNLRRLRRMVALGTEPVLFGGPS